GRGLARRDSLNFQNRKCLDISIMSDFDDFKNILRPWLGEVRTFSLPANSDDIYVFITAISGCGFRSLEWQKNDADQDWILPRWRTKSGVICPRCQTEIQAMLQSHRTGVYTKA